MTYTEWVSANTKINGRPFSCQGYEFQQAILDDTSPNLSVIKPSQVGMTEIQIRKFLAKLARHRGTAGIFTFPNEKMFKKNSKTRFRPVVAQPVFAASSIDDDKPARAMDLYEVCGSFAHVTGLTEGDATSTPADFLSHDEVDLSDQAMIGLFQSRLQNSDFRHTEKFSTPTHPGFGIDAAFNASDQHNYLVRCSACNHWQDPTFTVDHLHLPGYAGDGDLENLDVDTVARIDLQESWFKCSHCSRRLDLGDPGLREWVAAYPSRMARGYRIRPTATARLTPFYIVDQLMKMKQLDNVRGWKNTVLGETYSDGNSKLEPDIVKAVMKSPTVQEVGANPVALGCDMGKTCHLTLGVITALGTINPFLFEQVPSSEIVERITELKDQYRIVSGGVDRHPYTPTAEAIRDATKGVVLPLEYKGHQHVNPVYDAYDNLDYAQINRTRAIDEQVRAIQRRTTELSGYGGLGPVLVEQLCDMVRIESDEKPATWEKLTGNDHFLHSLALMRASVKVHDVIANTVKSETRSMIGIVPVGAPSLRNLGAPRHG